MLKQLNIKTTMKTTTTRKRADGVRICLLLSILYLGHLLILSGDVEVNPGPPKASTSRQTRLTSTAQISKRSSDTIQQEAALATQAQMSEPTLQDIMTLLRSMTDSLNETCQQTISEDDVIMKRQSTPKTTTQDTPMAEPATKDVLVRMHSKLDDLKDNLLQLTSVCSGIQEEVSDLKQKMMELKNENEEIKHTNSSLSSKVQALERKNDWLESQLKRNNVIFYGIAQKKKETNSECEKIVRKFLTEKLQFSEDVGFEKVSRINVKPDSPICVQFSSYRQKQLVFKSRFRLQGTRTFIGEDFPLRIRQVRKKLVPFLKDAKKNGKKATIIYDHLIIDGQKFYLGEDNLLIQQ